jgi:hypothetical protein
LSNNLKWKSIWNDPVWSKVIAAGIVAALGTIWASLRFAGLATAIRFFLTISIPLWLAILLFTLAASLIVFRRRGRGKQREDASTHKLREEISRRPVLSYTGIVGQGWFLLEIGPQWYFQVIQIKNCQLDIPTVANNLRARIEYRHADGERFVVEEALWLAAPHQIEFTTKLQLGSGKTGLLCLMAQQQGSDFSVVEDVSQRSKNKVLKGGKWNINVWISSDNGLPLIGEGSFTLSGEHQLVYAQPRAFNFETVKAHSVGAPS